MIRLVFNADDFAKAMGSARENLSREIPRGLDMLLDAVAARARGDHRYRDRSGNLTASTMSAGHSGDMAGGFRGVVSFAARSRSSRKYPQGYLYGLVQEHGTRDGRVPATKYITNAVKAQGAEPLEDALRRAFRNAGFEVVG